MKIPESIIQEIEDRINIIDIIGKYVDLKREGRRYRGLCPFHQEKTPSFTVTPEKGLFYCFGCQKGGNIFNFIMEIEKLSFIEAARMLASKVGITISAFEGTPSKKREAIYELYKRTAEVFHYILKNKEEAGRAREYLRKRKITDETIDSFLIGYAPENRDWLFKFLQKRNYSGDFLGESGLFSRKNREKAFFFKRLVFPIITSHGKVIGFGGRTLNGEEPKYINSPDSEIFRKGENVYGLNLSLEYIRKSGKFTLVEGYMDVLSLYQAGINNVVAPLGTAFTERQAYLLKRYANEGILMFDGDTAGVEATRKSIETCEKVGIDCRVVSLPEKTDPAELIQKHGVQALNNFLKSPINSFEYLIKKSLERHSSLNPEDKKAITEELFPYISNINSSVKREACLQELSETLNIDYSNIYSDFISTREPHADSRNKTRIITQKEIDIDEDLFLMIAVTENLDYFKYVRNNLFVDDLESPYAKSLFIALEECFRNNENSLDSVLLRIEEEELRNLIIEKAFSEEFEINQEQIIKDCIKRIKGKSMEKKRLRIMEKLKSYERDNTHLEKIKELLSEKMYLDKEIEKLRVGSNDRITD